MNKKELEKDKRLYRTYGLTLVEWCIKLSEQKGVCKICKTLPPSGRLSVDHIHVPKYKELAPEEKKKYVRGLICYFCNVALGKFERTKDGARNRRQLEGTYQYFKVYRLKGE